MQFNMMFPDQTLRRQRRKNLRPETGTSCPTTSKWRSSGCLTAILLKNSQPARTRSRPPIDDVRALRRIRPQRTLPRNIDFEGLRVIIDCANGAAYGVAPEVLWELGTQAA